MHCSATDFAFLGCVTALVLTGLFSTWKYSSLVKVLELRHPATYASLGKPNPVRTAESDGHALAALGFVLSNHHEMLADKEVTQKVKALRTHAAISTALFLVMAFSLLLAQSPEATVTLACWRQ